MENGGFYQEESFDDGERRYFGMKTTHKHGVLTHHARGILDGSVYVYIYIYIIYYMILYWSNYNQQNDIWVWCLQIGDLPQFTV